MQDKIILVPDIHQNIEWFKRIINKEGYYGAYYILMGDYFDERGGEAWDDLEAFCIEFQKVLANINYEALIGNHDALYFEKERNCDNPEVEFPNEKYIFGISGVYDVIERTQTIKKNLPGFLKKLKSHTYVGNYLISHAGVNKLYYDYLNNAEKLLDKLYYNNLTSEKENKIITGIGYSRGGHDRVGGILWQDMSEFRDIPLAPQIFAHNRKYNKPIAIGNSWMIDIAQTYYGVYNCLKKELTFEKA